MDESVNEKSDSRLKISNMKIGADFVIDRKYGFVAVLDALGTKNRSIEQIKSYVDSLNTNIKMFEDIYKDLLNDTLISQKLNLTKENLKFLLVQDSVIMTMDVFSYENIVKNLFFFSFLLNMFISGNFINKVLFRGAVSYGEYFSNDNNFCFGETLNDAIAWHDQIELIGIMATPKFSNYIDNISYKIKTNTLNFSDKDKKVFKELFTKYSIPLKRSKFIGRLFNWPLSLSHLSSVPNDNTDQDSNALGYYLDKLKSYDIPIGTQEKYENTTNFVKKIFKNFPEYLDKKRPYPNIDSFKKEKNK